MLTPEDNILLTRVGRGTSMGELMRRYWHPIALSTQVSAADGPPLRTKLLGQRFVVFRDTQGRVGVLDEACMHRGVSLALGRNEEGGLRCLYHGWKFAVDGTILETPNHADCRLRERTRAPAYPVREQGGLIWTYIGPKEHEPPFRTFIWDIKSDAHRAVFRANTKANWLPLWEGGLDSSHVAILHTNVLRPSWSAKIHDQSEVAPIAWDHLAPTYEIEETPFGFHYCAFRDIPGQQGAKRNARLVPAIMPYMRIIPGKLESNYAIEVPMDDHETATYVCAFSETDEPLDREAWAKFLGFDSPYYDWETHNVNFDWDANRLGQDRSRMKTSWTGIHGLEMEDFTMSMSLTPDWDRSEEHLVASDIAVVRLRRMLLQALRRFHAGETPPGLTRADMTKVIAYDRDIAKDDRWQDFAPHNKVAVAAE